MTFTLLCEDDTGFCWSISPGGGGCTTPMDIFTVDGVAPYGTSTGVFGDGVLNCACEISITPIPPP